MTKVKVFDIIREVLEAEYHVNSIEVYEEIDVSVLCEMNYDSVFVSALIGMWEYKYVTRNGNNEWQKTKWARKGKKKSMCVG